jgi:predicted dehydrogenase
MKFLIIGAGMIGETHTRVLKKMGYKIALCDTLFENAKKLGEQFGIDELYNDLETALRMAKANAVVICTPNNFHAHAAIRAMESGCDVLCEKPIASSVDQAKQMLNAQKETGRRLMVGYIVRAYEALEYVQKILQGNSLGRLLSARCILATPETLDVAKTKYRLSYETGGGIIYDYTHELDYCRLLFGKAESAAAFCGSYLRRDESVDDSADMLIRYQSGLVLSLHMDYIQRVGRTGCSRSFEIICEKGVLACDFHSVRVDWNDGRSEIKHFRLDWDEAFERQAKRFLEFVKGTDGLCASGLDGLRALELADQLYHSSRTGTVVRLGEDGEE